MRRLGFLTALVFLFQAPASAQVTFELPGEDVGSDLVPGDQPGNPTFNLGPNMRLVSAFGERPVYSPDGKRMAFIGHSYGDAFEIDLDTGEIRNLTAHAAHNGFLRIHYLPDGSYVLLGPRVVAKSREATRFSAIELFWMDAEAKRPPVALERVAFEGLAIGHADNLIAWAEMTSVGPLLADVQATTIRVGNIDVSDGQARLTNVRDVLTTTREECFVEPQNFLPGDNVLTMPCYYQKAQEVGRETEVMLLDLTTGQTSIVPTPQVFYGEVEGLSPDGTVTFIECSADRFVGLDICLLDLADDAHRLTRVTRVMDYGEWKVSNPVFRPDGRQVAMQIGSADVPDAGVGQGIVIIDIAE